MADVYSSLTIIAIMRNVTYFQHMETKNPTCKHSQISFQANTSQLAKSCQTISALSTYGHCAK